MTRDGFVPAEVTAKRGQPVKLVVTRQVERTCATEIVMKDFGVNAPLPLGTAVGGGGAGSKGAASGGRQAGPAAPSGGGMASGM